VIKYDVALKSDEYLLLFHGSHDEAIQVEKLLDNSGHVSLDVHGVPVLAGQA